ncbi:MAG: hypothetical protein KBS52_04760 [Clostridiales bacterium]|nr:hypothetical protein [Candidatus Equinaster intestinalis]
MVSHYVGRLLAAAAILGKTKRAGTETRPYTDDNIGITYVGDDVDEGGDHGSE